MAHNVSVFFFLHHCMACMLTDKLSYTQGARIPTHAAIQPTATPAAGVIKKVCHCPSPIHVLTKLHLYQRPSPLSFLSLRSKTTCSISSINSVSRGQQPHVMIVATPAQAVTPCLTSNEEVRCHIPIKLSMPLVQYVVWLKLVILFLVNKRWLTPGVCLCIPTSLLKMWDLFPNLEVLGLCSFRKSMVPLPASRCTRI